MTTPIPPRPTIRSTRNFPASICPGSNVVATLPRSVDAVGGSVLALGAASLVDLRRNAGRDRAGRHVLEHDGVGTDDGAAANPDRTEHTRAASDDDVVLDHRAAVVLGGTDRVVTHELHARPDLRRA